jgi:HAD superfamily hydrolase (TIGR01549 family)
MLQAVTLDFWNTLFVDRGGREREHARAAQLRDELALVGMHPSQEWVHEALLTGYQYFDEVWRRESRTPDTAEIVDTVLETLRARLPAEARARIVERFANLLLETGPEPVPGAPETLPRLAERWRLAVVCDTGYSPGAVLRTLLERYDMLGHFRYLYFSDEGGVSKPDPRVFRHVLDKLGARAGEAAHVGDLQRTDIAGAQGAGMYAIHFIGANAQDLPASTADAVVTRFDELPRALGTLVCPGC